MPIPPNDKSLVFGGVFMLANRMQAVGDSYAGELTVKQWFLLLVVRDLPDGSSIADIAADAGTTRQNVKKLLAQLASKGYVTLAQSPQDKRSTAVHMTGKGRTYMREVSVEGYKLIDRMLAGVSEQDIQATGRLILRAVENLEAIKHVNMEDEA